MKSYLGGIMSDFVKCNYCGEIIHVSCAISVQDYGVVCVDCAEYLEEKESER